MCSHKQFCRPRWDVEEVCFLLCGFGSFSFKWQAVSKWRIDRIELINKLWSSANVTLWLSSAVTNEAISNQKSISHSWNRSYKFQRAPWLLRGRPSISKRPFDTILQSVTLKAYFGRRMFCFTFTRNYTNTGNVMFQNLCVFWSPIQKHPSYRTGGQRERLLFKKQKQNGNHPCIHPVFTLHTLFRVTVSWEWL